MKMKMVWAVLPLVIVLAAGDAVGQTTTSFRWRNLDAGSLQDADGIDIPLQGATILTFVSAQAGAPSAAVLSDSIKNSGAWSTSYSDGAWTATFYEAMPNLGPGRLITDFMTETDPNYDYVGMVAYAVAIDVPYASFVDIASLNLDIGNVYYGVAGASPAIQNMNTIPAGTDQSFGGFFVQTTEVIPEPSVLALLGLGGLLMVVRRRFVRS